MIFRIWQGRYAAATLKFSDGATVPPNRQMRLRGRPKIRRPAVRPLRPAKSAGQPIERSITLLADSTYSRCRENWRSVSLHFHGRARKLELLAVSEAPGLRQ
jgi:hypothetical protein